MGAAGKVDEMPWKDWVGLIPKGLALALNCLHWGGESWGGVFQRRVLTAHVQAGR